MHQVLGLQRTVVESVMLRVKKQPSIGSTAVDRRAVIDEIGATPCGG